jgi:hypothetical protein
MMILTLEDQTELGRSSVVVAKIEGLESCLGMEEQTWQDATWGFSSADSP